MTSGTKVQKEAAESRDLHAVLKDDSGSLLALGLVAPYLTEPSLLRLGAVSRHFRDLVNKVVTCLQPADFYIEDFSTRVPFPNLEKLVLSGVCRPETITNTTMRLVHRKYRKLTTLNLAGCIAVTDEGLRSVAQMQSLTSLTLRRCRGISDEGLRCLAQQGKLATLGLAECERVTDTGMSHLSQLSTLTSLDLSCCVLTDAGMASVAQITGLTELRLDACPMVTDVGLVQLVGSLRSLRVLSISGNDNLAEPTLMGISTFCREKLEELYCGWCHQALGGTGLGALTSLKALKSLDISSIGKPDAIIPGLQAAGKLSTLTSLTLINIPPLMVPPPAHDPSTDLDEGLRSVASLPLLASLNISESRVTDAGVEAVKGCAALATLNLAGCIQVTDVSLAAIGEMPSLTALNLSHAPPYDLDSVLGYPTDPLTPSITGAGMVALAGATALKNLNINWSPAVTDQGIAALATLPALTVLTAARHVGRGAPPGGEGGEEPLVTDRAVRALAGLSAGPGPGLTELDMSWWDEVSPEGVGAVAGITTLERLNMHGCPGLVDEGLRTLSRMPSLTRLEICDCRRVTTEGLTALSRAPSLCLVDLTNIEGIVTDDVIVAMDRSFIHQYLFITKSKVTDRGLLALQDVPMALQGPDR